MNKAGIVERIKSSSKLLANAPERSISQLTL